MQKLTLNIVYSVTLSLYQHRADIVKPKCSANRRYGGQIGSRLRVCYILNPLTSFDINMILYVVMIFFVSWCVYSGETDVCAGIENPGLVRHIFQLAQCGFACSQT